MKIGLFAAVVVAALAARADEVVRWYDSAQKLTWGYVVTNGRGCRCHWKGVEEVALPTNSNYAQNLNSIENLIRQEF